MEVASGLTSLPLYISGCIRNPVKLAQIIQLGSNGHHSIVMLSLLHLRSWNIAFYGIYLACICTFKTHPVP